MAIDLQAFCDNDADGVVSESRRYAFRRPWLEVLAINTEDGGINGEYAIATDGRILVAAKQDVPWEPKDVRRPDVEGILKTFPLSVSCDQWQDIPAKLKHCNYCKDTGKIIDYCSECGGKDFELCRKCTTKLGTKSIQRVMMNRIIANLPNCKWLDSDNRFDTCLWLKFDGGLGCVMPVFDVLTTGERVETLG